MIRKILGITIIVFSLVYSGCKGTEAMLEVHDIINITYSNNTIYIISKDSDGAITKQVYNNVSQDVIRVYTDLEPDQKAWVKLKHYKSEFKEVDKFTYVEVHVSKIEDFRGF